VQVSGVRGGRAHVRGTGLTVALIARFHQMGASPEELLAAYPQLSAGGLYDALSYYHDHRAEIDAELASEGDLQDLQRRFGVTFADGGRVVFGASRGR
jgi:uncharacterized protein (DUF433 family)